VPRYLSILLVVPLIAVAGAGAARPGASRPIQRKPCRKVTKTVHGRRVRVRVCPAAKPRLPKLTIKANPRRVAPKPDAARTASRLISAADGGSISATGKDGTSYTLTVPPGALAEDTTLSVTPVRAIGGLKMGGGLIGAALLQPEGTRFWVPVTLTIVPHARPKAGKRYVLLSFASHDDGSQFHLAPQTSKGGGISLALDHFTETGAALGTVDDLELALLHTPVRLSDEYRQLQGALEANAEWVRQHPGQDRTLAPLYSTEELLALEGKVLAKEFDQDVEPELELAIQGGLDATAALQDAVAWQRQVELQKLEGKFADRLKLMQERIQQLVQSLAKPCETAPHALTYYPGLGFVIDQKDALRAFVLYRELVLHRVLEASDAFLDTVLKPCRPAGLKFSGLKWREEVHDLVYPVSYSQYELVSARVCGYDFDAIWQTKLSEDDNWPLFGHLVFSGAVDGEWQPGGPLAVHANLLGTPNHVDLEFGPTVTATLTIFGPTNSSDDWRLNPQVTEAPVEEDLTCPKPA
jgi:hypothetical protein